MGRVDNPLFELALRLEELALKDDYFVARKLYPNVDFYSGIIYSALGIPRSMFTVMFAIARTVGWVAHWLEMISDPTMRIGRPRQLYLGPVRRDYRRHRETRLRPDYLLAETSGACDQGFELIAVCPPHGTPVNRAVWRLVEYRHAEIRLLRSHVRPPESARRGNLRSGPHPCAGAVR